MTEENTTLNIGFDSAFEMITNAAAGLIEIAIQTIMEAGGQPTPEALAQALGLMFKSTMEDIDKNDLDPDHVMALAAIGASIFAIADLLRKNEENPEE